MSIRSRVGRLRDEVCDVALRPSKKRRFRRDFEKAQAAGQVNVNVGSGGKPLPGWINCDVVWRGESYLDATKSWPVPAGSVHAIYADNVIEHIPLEGGRLVFKYAYEALAPGGVFRLATPDVEAVARQYLENGDLARLGIERNRERGRNFIYPVQLLYQVYVGAEHYRGFCYDYDSISAEMEAAGFVVTRVAAGKSDRPELVGLEARLHPAEEATALIVEGLKIA
jgi:predicted SAM-dependent methyltransferase